MNPIFFWCALRILSCFGDMLNVSSAFPFKCFPKTLANGVLNALLATGLRALTCGVFTSFLPRAAYLVTLFLIVLRGPLLRWNPFLPNGKFNTLKDLAALKPALLSFLLFTLIFLTSGFFLSAMSFFFNNWAYGVCSHLIPSFLSSYRRCLSLALKTCYCLWERWYLPI